MNSRSNLLSQLTTAPNHVSLPCTPALCLIAAVARNGAIGRDNALLWHEPEDQRHFRQTTFGYPVIMGRKTWDSLPQRFRPLPGRRNVVLTTQQGWHAFGADAVSSVVEALGLLQRNARAFVIGGAQIYKLTLPLADRLVLTEIDVDLDGDTWFPTVDRCCFQVVAREPHVTANGIRYCFVTYQRTTFAT